MTLNIPEILVTSPLHMSNDRRAPLLSTGPTFSGVMCDPEASPRVLSIQSHVVSGYVGNKAATFPLQLLGFDVDVINSVHFSNHTGYKEGWEGDVMKGDQLRSVLQGLERNGLLVGLHGILTGYIGSISFLEAVIDVLQAVKKYSEIRYVCDPVLGDSGKFYVAEELVEVYRTTVVPLADIITPNQFEVEKLTGICVDSEEKVAEACRALHDLGPPVVCVTSISLPTHAETMSMVASQRENDGTTRAWKVDFPVLPGHFTGTGDLAAALLLAHTATYDLPRALERVINTMHVVLSRTLQASRNDDVASRELRLIQSKREIEDPPVRFTAVQIL